MTELKDKCRQIVTAKFNPGMMGIKVDLMTVLKPTWIALEEAGLIQKGWTYSQFVRCAEIEQFKALLRGAGK